MRLPRSAATLLALALFSLAAIPSVRAANAPTAPAVPPAPAPMPTPAPAAPAAPADPAAGNAEAADAANPVMTITLINLNQIVGTIVERDKETLTLQTAEGLFKLRLNKILKEEVGGTLQATSGTKNPAPAAGAGAPLAGPSGGAGGGSAGGGKNGKKSNANPTTNGPVNPADMTPDERVKAAQKKLQAAQKQVDTYRQAIQTQVGGVPQGQSPTSYTPNQQGTGTQQQTPYGQNANTWQPFSSDNPKANTNNNNTNPYQQNGVTNGYNNGYNAPYGTSPYQNVPPSQMFYQATPQNGTSTWSTYPQPGR